MKELLPIVRRVRRPLIGEPKAVVAVRNVEPVKDVDEVVTPVKSVTPANADEETATE